MTTTKYIFNTSKLLNNFTDEENLDLSAADMDAIDAILDNQEYAFHWFQQEASVQASEARANNARWL